jgi:putative ABC transport system permease protein
MKITKAFRKNITRTITGSFGRYMAILLIVMLGVGFLSGLVLTNPVMMKVEENFINQTNFYDLRLLSTIGFDEDDVKAVSAVDGVETVESSVTADVLVNRLEDSIAMRAHMLLDHINTVELADGRMPEKGSECLIDATNMSGYQIGDTIVLADDNQEDTLSLFAFREYTIVGSCYSSLYMSMEAGNTDIGDGTLSGYLFIPRSGFDSEYDTEIYLTISKQYELYSDEYEDAITELSDLAENAALVSTDSRFQKLYNDGKESLIEAQETLDRESADAKQKLDDAKRKLDDAKATLDDANIQIAEGEKQLADSKEVLEQSKQSLDQAAAKMDEDANSWEQALETARTSLKNATKEFKAQTKAAQEELDEAYSNLQQSKSQLDQLKALIDSGYATEEQIQTYEAGMVQYQKGLKSYETNLASLNATITATQKQLDKTKSELDTFESGIKEYYEGLDAYESGLKDLKASQIEYEDGLAKYEAGMAEYEDGLADYKKDIEDAQAEIDEGWEELEELEEPSVFVMDRNYNTGYSTYQNDASIVNKIATVLPIFFFLIAALVCSTTMTRMIDDDRTDIGTLRALGYQKGAIYFKYICYSGSAAIIGCIIGYLGLGYLFPQVIWIAYKMLYKIPGTAVIYSAWLFALCLILSLLCSVGVTILNLRHVLKEMPAELIRPVAPPAGKRILLEYIGFIWKRLKFLHKVTLRNIFRFKKRMIMMILGIAGCTGLIVTGFGIHDSVSDICDYQYDDIMQYDLSVQTSDEVDAKLLDKIESACGDSFSQMVSAVQKSVDITGEDATKSVYVIASDDTKLKDFIS